MLAGTGRPGGDQLVRDYFGMHRIDTVDEPDAVSSYRDDEDRARARRWPAECIWRLRQAWPPG